MNEFVHAGLLLVESLVLCAVALYASRARRHARAAARSAHEARQEERLASVHATFAETAAKRAEATLPPDVIPFPESAVRGEEIPPPETADRADLLKLFAPEIDYAERDFRLRSE